MSKFKKVITDVLYVSKVTQTKNKKKLTILSVVFSQLSAYFDVAIVIIFSALLANQYPQTNLVEKTLDFVLSSPAIIVLIVLLRFFFQYFQKTIIYKIELSVNRNLKVYLLKEIFDKRNYSVADSYFYINVLSQHVSYFYSSFANFLNNFLQALVYLMFLILSNTSSLLVFFSGIVILFFPFKKLIQLSRLTMHEAYIKGQDSNKEVQRVIENLFLIKILKKDDDEINQFSKTLDTYVTNVYKNQRYGLVNGLLPTFITTVVLSLLISSSFLSIKLTLDFIAVILRLFQSLGNIVNSANQIINSHVHIEKFNNLENNKVKQNKSNFKLDSRNLLKFENVNFKYFNESEFIFENINLEISKGAHVILTGKNGSGKSTLLGLIAGIYFPNSGKVTTFSERYGYIGTQPHIFDASLKENLKYGTTKKFDESIALDYLKFFETFRENEKYNLENIINNKNLSSGQMQKIAFVRALLSEIDILLLDESTSNLDRATKNKIFETLRNKKITIINSTHEPDEFDGFEHRYNIEVINGKRVVKKI